MARNQQRVPQRDDEKILAGMEEIRRRYIRSELSGRVKQLAAAIGEMANAPDNLDKVVNAARLIHSVYGSCRMFDLPLLADVLEPCHRVFFPLYRNPRPADEPQIRMAQQTLARVEADLEQAIAESCPGESIESV